MYYVYILKGKNKHYIGYTNNIQRRLSEHRRGGSITTRIMKEFVLLGYFEKEMKEDAQKLEKMIKRDGHIQHQAIQRSKHITSSPGLDHGVLRGESPATLP